MLGGSSGIGLAAARALGASGHAVHLVARDEAKLAAARDGLLAAGAQATATRADIGVPAELARAVAEATSALGAVDVLVANGGGPPPGRALTLDDHAFHAALDSVALPALHAIRAVTPGMVARRFGRVVIVASTSVRAPIDDLDLSNFLRAGLAAVVRTLARELAADGVTVNMVLPGSILTDRSRGRIEARAAREGVTFEAALAQSSGRIPAKRLGAPEEVGSAIAFLASASASYITGAALPVDGGALTGMP